MASLACTESSVVARVVSSVISRVTSAVVTGLACTAISRDVVALSLKAFGEDGPQLVALYDQHVVSRWIAQSPSAEMKCRCALVR